MSKEGPKVTLDEFLKMFKGETRETGVNDIRKALAYTQTVHKNVQILSEDFHSKKRYGVVQISAKKPVGKLNYARYLLKTK